MKLSKTQLELLKKFGEGGQLEKGQIGPDVWYYWKAKPYSARGLRSTTIHKLWKLGLISDIDPNPFETSYRITDKGRAYLDGLPGGRCVK